MSRLLACTGRALGATAVLALVALMASPAAANGYTHVFDKDPNHQWYGDLNQNQIPAPLGAAACGPTAAVNSFVYLQRKYQVVYGTLLVPKQPNDTEGDGDVDFDDDMIAVAQTVAGPAYMNTKTSGVPGGTYDDMFIYGKQKYLEQVAAGKTIYGAQMRNAWAWAGTRLPGDIPPVAKPDWVEDNRAPQWEFLWDNLIACEDIEILITDGDWGHFLTLTSMNWIDTDYDSVVDWEENGQIDYVDPSTGAKGLSKFWQTTRHGQLFVDYGGQHGYAQLVMAVHESPVPEPAMIALLLLGGVSLLGRRRRK